MKCDRARPLFDAYVDGELPAGDRERVARHLETCVDCAAVHAEMVALNRDVAGTGRHQAPAGLRQRVLSDLENETPPSAVTGLRTAWLKFATPAMAAGLVLGWLAGPVVSGFVVGDAELSSDIVAAHVRSQMADHLTDIASSDMHTVRPWFNGRLDFSPPVLDLTDAGFPLLGGRLDYLDHRPVAALLYRHRQHVINLFIWPKSGTPGLVAASARHGYSVLNWQDGDLTYWAVSDLNGTDMQKLRDLLLRRAPAKQANRSP